MGAGGYPKFFITLNPILFVSINYVQNFKTEAQPLLGEKFVWWVGGWWCVNQFYCSTLVQIGLDLDFEIWT